MGDRMEKKKFFTRYTAAIIMVVISFLLLLFKLADIQIARGEDFRRQAQDKSIRTVDDEAPRGKILDRNGLELATNVQSYTIFMMKPEEEGEDLNTVIERLVDILNKRNEKINDDFCIKIENGSNGKYNFKFEFPNNNTDAEAIAQYNEKAAKRWKKENGIKENYTAEQSFYYLKDIYKINPVQKEHNTLSFIRQIMVIRQMLKDRQYEAYKPVEIAYVSRETAFEIMEKGLYLPGVDYKLKPLRKYPLGDMASLIIGSLRKVPDSKASDYVDRHYDISTDLIGRDGIEAYAEEDLRGEKGGRTVKVDALGRIVEELGKRDPIPGNNVVLTLDSSLQKVAEKSLDDVMQQLRSGKLDRVSYPYATRGAAVVIDVKTGEILAMASRPGGYDPNVMAATGSIDLNTWKVLSGDKSLYPEIKNPERIPKPMLNLATQSPVPPGSTFKMISAIAGLETGAITPSTIIRDLGEYKVVKNFPGACWLWNYHPGQIHGNLNVVSALKVSCNYFFFEVGHRVHLNNLTKYAKLFGLSNEPTGVEIAETPGDVANIEAAKATAVLISTSSTLKDISQPGYDKEIGTFVPTKEQEKLIKDMISNNDTSVSKLKEAGITSAKIRSRIIEGVRIAYREYNNQWMELNAAIGQGDDRFTPLQVANYIATIANGGTRLRPHLVKEYVSPDGTVLKKVEPEVLNKVDLKPDTLQTVIQGMDAVTGEGGTAGSTFRNFSIKIAGKTGTAQASGGMDDYSWFAGFAPADNPQIAVAVVIHEGGGKGSANVARTLFEHYFGLDKPAQTVTP